MPVSYNFVDFVVRRAQGLSRRDLQIVNEEYGTRHMITTGMFKERLISLNRMNKVNIYLYIYYFIKVVVLYQILSSLFDIYFAFFRVFLYLLILHMY